MMNHPFRSILVAALREDIAQMVAEEGHDAEGLNAELEHALASDSLDALAQLQVSLWQRPSPPGFGYDEPSDWETLSTGFPSLPDATRFSVTDEVLQDRMLGAWLGRCAGCQLGKPVEQMKPEPMRAMLRISGGWPLLDYMPPMNDAAFRACHPDGAESLHTWMNSLARGGFDHVAPDDDIHYAIYGLTVLERHGPGFTGNQALDTLIDITPSSSVFASGQNAFRTRNFGFEPPATACFGNRWRQSLGAQIRCDAWGWAAPGKPRLAAGMAYRDAACSQMRNGIYSGIFFAVLLADAAAHGDPVRAIDTALAYVPPRSRFAEMVHDVKAACAAHDDWEAVNRHIHDRYSRLPDGSETPFNHCLPNAAIVIMALLAGGGDFSRTLGISVMAGLDTDCNGATTGSILGIARGAAQIPAHWTRSFNDTIRTELKWMGELKISDVARRTGKVVRKIESMIDEQGRVSGEWTR